MYKRQVLGGLGIAIISTNQGVVTDKKARELQVGGEVLALSLIHISLLDTQSLSMTEENMCLYM